MGFSLEPARTSETRTPLVLQPLAESQKKQSLFRHSIQTSSRIQMLSLQDYCSWARLHNVQITMYFLYKWIYQDYCSWAHLHDVQTTMYFYTSGSSSNTAQDTAYTQTQTQTQTTQQLWSKPPKKPRFWTNSVRSNSIMIKFITYNTNCLLLIRTG